MQFIKTGFKDLWLCEPRVFGDHRGYFFEAFNKEEFKQETGLEVEFVQQNESHSSKGVLRGLHLQQGDFAQAKFIRVLHGSVLDVVVDLRKDEPTFGKQYQVELTAENKRQLFVPQDFAHGFLVTSETATFVYSCDNFYAPEHELSLSFFDEKLGIELPLSKEELKLSRKDEEALKFDDVVKKLYG